MIFLQFTGLSGSGKTTLANYLKNDLIRLNYKVEILDGDEYRNTLCKDLSFSRVDRKENNRRLGILGLVLLRNNIIVIMSTINPFEEDRINLKKLSPKIFTIWIKCNINTLIARDTKGLYARALDSVNNNEAIYNLSGINDPYEPPNSPDLIVCTDFEEIRTSAKKILEFIFVKLKDF